MNRKIPQDAFGFYFSLGVSRSYGAVAEKYGVSKRAVALLASREQWQPRIAELERKARQRTDELAVESRERTREAPSWVAEGPRACVRHAKAPAVHGARQTWPAARSQATSAGTRGPARRVRARVR